MSGNKLKLGELLVAAGVLEQANLDTALADQKKWGGKLGRALIDLGYVREDLMVKALAKQLLIPGVDLDTATPGVGAVSAVPVQICERYGVFPLAYDEAARALTLATSDPTNDDALRDLRLQLRMRVISPVVASATAVDRAIRRFYWGDRTTAVPTATPQQLGISEPVLDLSAPPRSIPIPSGHAAGAPLPGELRGPDLFGAMERMEKLLSAEVRSLRTLVELLVEKGLLDREEYLRRVKER